MSSKCDSCPSKSGCSSKGSCSENAFDKVNKNSTIKTVIAVCSGKGGVGKSFVTSLLASGLNKAGLKVGVLDADITGPSIPRAFGLSEKLYADDDNQLIPAETPEGIKAVSLNLLLDKEDMPVVWRSPVITSVVKQFWTEVNWGMLDVLLIDMPPGTGDVPLTVFQSIPVDGIVFVSTPQDMVSMIVSKSVNMAEMMSINIVGLVQNMSYIKCPHCDEKIDIFGDGKKVEEAADRLGIKLLDKLPLDSTSAELADSGKVTSIDAEMIKEAVEEIKSLVK